MFTVHRQGDVRRACRTYERERRPRIGVDHDVDSPDVGVRVESDRDDGRLRACRHLGDEPIVDVEDRHAAVRGSGQCLDQFALGQRDGGT